MTREHKLALIVGFSLVLVVGILVSDHFSKARTSQPVGELTEGTSNQFGNGSGGLRSPAPPPAAVTAAPAAKSVPTPSNPLPGSEIAARPVVSSDPQPGTTLTMGNERLPSEDGHPPELNKDFRVAALSGLIIDRLPTADGAGSLSDPNSPSAIPTPRADSNQKPTVVDPRLLVPVPPTEPMLNGIPVSRMTRYEVREGDSIYRIAQTHLGDGRQWEKLRPFNVGKLGKNGEVREGVTLFIPPREGATVPVPAIVGTVRDERAARDAKDSKDAKKDSAAPATYTVQKGDDLSRIAQKALGNSRRAGDIADLNRLLDPDDLQIGTVLKLPKR